MKKIIFSICISVIITSCEKEYFSPKPAPDPYGIPVYLYIAASNYAPSINCSVSSTGHTLVMERNFPLFDVTSAIDLNKITDSLAVLIGKNVYYPYWNFNYYNDRISLPPRPLKHYDETDNPNISDALGDLKFYVSCDYFLSVAGEMQNVKKLYNVKTDAIFKTIH